MRQQCRCRPHLPSFHHESIPKSRTQMSAPLRNFFLRPTTRQPTIPANSPGTIPTTRRHTQPRSRPALPPAHRRRQTKERHVIDRLPIPHPDSAATVPHALERAASRLLSMPPGAARVSKRADATNPEPYPPHFHQLMPKQRRYVPSVGHPYIVRTIPSRDLKCIPLYTTARKIGEALSKLRRNQRGRKTIQSMSIICLFRPQKPTHQLR